MTITSLAVVQVGGPVTPTTPAALLPNPFVYQGTWNASTNLTTTVSGSSTAIVSGVGVQGTAFKVSVAGSTSIDGQSSWNVGDYIWFNGTTWDRILGAQDMSVPGLRSFLRIDQATTVSDSDFVVTASMSRVAMTAITAPRNGTLPALSTMNVGQAIIVYDESGSCSPTNTITLTAAGTDTINSVSTYVINAAFGGVMLQHAATTKWTALPLALPIATASVLGGVKISSRLAVAADGTLSGLAQPAVIQTVNNGPADTNGLPTFLPTTSASLSLTSQNVSTSTPLIMNAAQGANASGVVNYQYISTANLTWSGLTNSATNYLYINAQTGATGATTLAPIDQHAGTPSTTNGQFTFNIIEQKGYMGNGASAVLTPLVFVGECVASGGTITGSTAYAYNGFYDSGFTATLPTTNTTISKNHNLGYTPRGTVRLIVQNTTAELGYSVGDQLDNMSLTSNNGTVVIPLPIKFSRLSVSLHTGSSAAWDVTNFSTGANGAITAANWSWKFLVARGW